MALIFRKQSDGRRLGFEYCQALKSIAALLNLPHDGALLFLGAGASIDPRNGAQSLPTGAQLSRELAQESGFDWPAQVPLPTVAFYFEAQRSRTLLNRFLAKRIDVARNSPTPPAIDRLVDVVSHLEKAQKHPLIISTNYDRLFEYAYESKSGRNLDVAIYYGGMDPADKRNSLYSIPNPRWWRISPPPSGPGLFKMHGCISQANDHCLVITEEDFINFMANQGDAGENRGLPVSVVASLENSTIVFIGYSMEDWNFRVIFKATAERRDNRRYAVQFLPPDEELGPKERAKRNVLVRFWESKQVDIISADASEFLGDLHQVLASGELPDVRAGEDA